MRTWPPIDILQMKNALCVNVALALRVMLLIIAAALAGLGVARRGPGPGSPARPAPPLTCGRWLRMQERSRRPFNRWQGVCYSAVQRHSIIAVAYL